MLRVLLNGCNGKMGKVVSLASLNFEDIEIVAGLDINETKSFSYPVFSNCEQINIEFDCIIDFSIPEATLRVLDYAVKLKKPIVIATTGFNTEQREKIFEASKHIPIFWSYNMSLGVNLVMNLIQKAYKTLGKNFDIEIIEKHHNQKIDAPSGTALMLADAINEVANNNFEYIYDRHNRRKKRSSMEIGIHSMRGGTIVGEHSVIFAGQDEIIEIKHTAMSKEIFAYGALNASRFIVRQKEGIYNMNNLINSL